jgi:hypothetical protein
MATLALLTGLAIAVAILAGPIRTALRTIVSS